MGEQWWSADISESHEPVTREALLRFVEQLKNMPPDPCSLGNHVVSMREKDRGYGICANCMRPVGEWP